MSDVDELIRGELTRLVDRAPMPPSVGEIAIPRATPQPPRRPRAILAVAAAVTATVAIAGATVIAVAGRDGDGREGGRIRTAPAGPAFVETVDWPHFLVAAPPAGAELQLVQEIRPGGLPSSTTQSWRVGDGGGSILLTVEASPGATGEGPLDASGDAVQGHPITWLDDQNSPNMATWSWPGAQVLVYVNGLSREAAMNALAKLEPREEGLAAEGFNGPPDGSMSITSEHFGADGQPAISRAWYGTEDRIDLEVQAVAPIPDLTPTLDLVSISGDGTGKRRTLAGRDALVAGFGAWTTVAWFEADGTFVSVHARDLDDAELEPLVAGIQRVDQPTWDAAVAGLGERVAARPTVGPEIVDLGDGRLTARGGTEESATSGEIGPDLCLTVADGAGQCTANLGRRDGGPYVVGPAGLLQWTPHEVSSAIGSFVVDGTWWVVGRLSRSQSPVVETAAGPVETEVVESDGATWFLAAMPNDVDRYVLSTGGTATAGWRPSSGD